MPTTLVRSLRWLVLLGALVAAGAESLALFAVVDGLLQPRVPFPAGERVIEVSYRQTDGRVPGVRYLPEFGERRTAIFATLSDPSLVDVSVQTTRSIYFDPVEADDAGIRVAAVDGRFFDLVGTLPAVGQVFDVGDERATDARTSTTPFAAVVSWEFAQRFGSADRALGVRDVAGRRVMIRGVMPPAFRFPGETNIWVPTSRTAARLPSYVRLKPGVDVAQLERALPEVQMHPVTAPAREQASLPLMLLLTSSLLVGVALIQCAALLSTDVMQRSREIAIRLVLGASPARLRAGLALRVAALVAVAVLLAGFAARAILPFLVGAMPSSVVFGRYFTFGTNAAVWGSSLALVALAVLVSVPLLTAEPLLRVTGISGRLTGRPAFGRRHLVLGVQLALTAALLYTALLSATGYARAMRVDYGFEPKDTWWFSAPSGRIGELPAAESVREFDRLQALLVDSMEAIGALPGVTATAGAFRAPLGEGFHVDGESSDVLTFQGRPQPGLVVETNTIGPGFINALGARLIAGRNPQDADISQPKGNILINRTLAQRLVGVAPDGDLAFTRLIGQRIETRWHRGQVVGVIDDLIAIAPDRNVEPELFEVAAESKAFTGVIIRATADAEPSVRAELEKRWGAFAHGRLRPMVRKVDAIVAPYASQARLMSLVMLGAVPVALLGVFSALSFLVQSRRQELGVRIALGATPAQIRWIVLGPSVGLVLISWFVGVLIGVASCRWAGLQIFQGTEVDVAAMAWLAVVLCAIAAVAATVPLRRAQRIDPAMLLREGSERVTG